MKDEVKMRHFIRDLMKVCKKYNAEIGGCGCCGSPFIIISKDIHADDLSIDEKKATVDFLNKDGTKKRLEVNSDEG